MFHRQPICLVQLLENIFNSLSYIICHMKNNQPIIFHLQFHPAITVSSSYFNLLKHMFNVKYFSEKDLHVKF
jgi:hypothetical protein